MTSNKLLKDLLDRVARGDADPADALEQLVEAFRAQPFEDLGFARIDHHRSIRQGFPEVILGLGKTPAQVAASTPASGAAAPAPGVTVAGVPAKPLPPRPSD